MSLEHKCVSGYHTPKFHCERSRENLDRMLQSFSPSYCLRIWPVIMLMLALLTNCSDSLETNASTTTSRRTTTQIRQDYPTEAQARIDQIAREQKLLGYEAEEQFLRELEVQSTLDETLDYTVESNTIQSGTNQIREVKLFKNPIDSSTYYYQEYWNDTLHNQGFILNGIRSGKWEYYLGNGDLFREDWYAADKLVRFNAYFSESAIAKVEFQSHNDTLGYERNLFSNGSIHSEGWVISSLSGMIPSDKFGEWSYYDSSGTYLTKGVHQGIKERVEESTDSLTGEIFTVHTYSPKRIGIWTKTYLNSGKIDTLDLESDEW